MYVLASLLAGGDGCTPGVWPCSPTVLAATVWREERGMGQTDTILPQSMWNNLVFQSSRLISLQCYPNIQCLEPSVSAPGFVLQLLRKIDFFSLIFFQSCKTKPGTEMLGSRLLNSPPWALHCNWGLSQFIHVNVCYRSFVQWIGMKPALSPSRLNRRWGKELK